MTTKPYFGSCAKNNPMPLFAQIVVPNAATGLVTQSVIASMVYRVDRYDSRDEAVACTPATEVIDDTALSKTSVIFDTLQTTGDGGVIVTDKGTGWNFFYNFPAASFPVGGKWYGVEVWITPSSGDAYRAAWYVLECAASAKS